LDFSFLEGDPNPSCSPGFSFGYSDAVCRVGQHFFNERTADLPKFNGATPDHHVIPACDPKKTDPKKTEKHNDNICDAIIERMNDICWPHFTKAHLVGHNTHFTDNSVGLLLGALVKRAAIHHSGIAHDNLNTAYSDMMKAAQFIIKENDKNTNQHEGHSEGALKDDDKDVLLMSSHDATTNGVRLIMMDAGLPVNKVTKWNDETNMLFTNELAYQVMLTFEVTKTHIMVHNLVASLKQTRTGCSDVEWDQMASLTKDPLGYTHKDFFTKMGNFLWARNDQKRLVDDSVKKYLTELKKLDSKW
jgi:hypothetical protein